MQRRSLLVLGATGMLGSAVFRALCTESDRRVVATARTSAALQYFSAEEQKHILTGIDVLDHDSLVDLISSVRPELIVNCVGLIKQFTASKDPLVALPLNALFPHRLARLAVLARARVIHVSTDCVFSGEKGAYTEEAVADATDLYGLSKRLGELADYQHCITLRTSIIGRELASSNSLVDWFLSQVGFVQGYQKAVFSGFPTCELASVIKNVVIPREDLHGLYHVSASAISKYDLLHLIAKQYGKSISIVPDDSVVIDRSLDSARFTAATGYSAPEWPELIKRMYDTDHRRDG